MARVKYNKYTLYLLYKLLYKYIHSYLNIRRKRMHSSRMRTTHALTIGGVPARGVPAWGYLPGGVPFWRVYLPGEGAPAQGCTCPGGGVPAQEGGVTFQGVMNLSGGCTCPGGCTCLGVYLPRYSPPVNTMTDRCKNITLLQTSFADGNNC